MDRRVGVAASGASVLILVLALGCADGGGGGGGPDVARADVGAPPAEVSDFATADAQGAEDAAAPGDGGADAGGDPAPVTQGPCTAVFDRDDDGVPHQIVQWTYEPETGRAVEAQVDREADGQLYRTDGVWDEVWAYEYDDEGRIVLEDADVDADLQTDRWTKSWTVAGLLSTYTVDWSGGDTPSQSWTRAYVPRTDRIHHVNWVHGEAFGTEHYIRDERGWTVRRDNDRGNDGTIDEIIEVENDEAGRVTSLAFIPDPETGVVRSTLRLAYDEAGRLVREEEFRGDAEEPFRTRMLRYDAAGRLVREWSQGDGPIVDSVVDYTYDCWDSQ